MDARAWHALTVEEVAKHTKTDLAKGLASETAAMRLLSGRNELPRPKRETWIGRILRQFRNPIALMLVVATPAAALVGTAVDASVIAAALLINIVIGVFQEGRASQTFEALRRKEATNATVLRDGAPREIPAGEVVYGDLVELAAGTAVPADLRVVESHGLATDESSLSGEWVPVEKQTETTAAEAPLTERPDMAFAGTLVVSGAGQGIVVATGAKTEFGAIAASLANVHPPETPIAQALRDIARFMFIAAVGIIASVFLLALLRGEPMRDAVLVAVAIAVAAVPEGLPAAVTVSLALGMERILKAGGLVKNLLAAETLGATTIILTDKTGTLTEGRMTVTGFATLAGTTEELDGEEAKKILRAAVLASQGYIETVTAPEPAEEKLVAHGAPVDRALVLAGANAGLSEEELRKECARVDELPFDASRRFGGALVREGEHTVAYLAGAPEVFIEHARKAKQKHGVKPFTARQAAYFEDALSHAARASEQVIGVARVVWGTETFPENEDYGPLLEHAVLLGFVLMSDPVRKEARAAVETIKSAGARVVMVTGDNAETAHAVASAVGIAGENARAYTGADLEKLSDDELYEALRSHTIFARVTPKAKLRISDLLSTRDEIVAMTGDGVNDAPALAAADIGVAIGSGTEVAKEAADLVLLTDSFEVITAAIREGRRLRDNMKKIFTYLIATNFDETFVIVAALVASVPLPLLPAQILWANLIGGGAMNVAFAFEPLYPSAMRRSPKDPETAHVLSKGVIRLVFLIGLITGLFLIGLYFYLVDMGMSLAEARTVMFVAISLDSVVTALSLKSLGTPLWRVSIFSNRFLIGAIGISIGLLLMALYIPGLAALLSVVPLSLFDLITLVFIALLDLVLVEVLKYYIFIRPDREREKVLAKAPVAVARTAQRVVETV